MSVVRRCFYCHGRIARGEDVVSVLVREVEHSPYKRVVLKRAEVHGAGCGAAMFDDGETGYEQLGWSEYWDRVCEGLPVDDRTGDSP